MESIPYLGDRLVRWRIGPSTFQALPERGARLASWTTTRTDGTVRAILHWPALDSLVDVHRVRGGNPILFPFSARTFDRGDIHFWRAADGVRRPMPIHGIARQGVFEPIAIDAAGFSARLVPDDAARAIYPFDYEFTVTYRFEAAALSCELALANRGAQPIPWCAGHHFYFAVPWLTNTARRDYTIRMPAIGRSRHDPRGAIVAGPALAPVEPLDNRELIDTIHGGLTANEAVLATRDGAESITVTLGTAPVPHAAQCFVTWTEADDSPFYCVEPWMGPPNAPEHGMGLRCVEPGATDRFVVGVRVR